MKKDKLIEDYLAKPILPGERVLVKGFGSQNKQHWGITTVVEVFKDGEICKPLVFSFKQDPSDLLLVIRNSEIRDKLSLLSNSVIPRAP